MMSYEFSDDEPELATLDISNDYYYQPIASQIKKPISVNRVPHSARLKIPIYGSKTIRHSLAAYDLWKPFFPTYYSDQKFRNYHRPKLRHYNNGPQAKGQRKFHRPQPIKSLSRNIFRSHNQLKQKIAKAICDGMSREDIISRFLLIKDARDLSAKTGEMTLFEYCEEHPPVLSQIGMASNIKIYSYGTQNGPSVRRLKRSTAVTQKTISTNLGDPNESQQIPRPFGFEEIVRDDKKSKRIYYNPMKPGSKIKMLENNMYRAPIYEHDLPSCDFLVVRTRNSYYIREVKTIFTVGQTLPLVVIPAPTEPNIQRFRCDLSNIYIHKLFNASETNPPSIKLDNLARLFPDYDRAVLQRRMRSCGTEVSVIRGEKVIIRSKSTYGMIDVLKLRDSLRPEVYCLNMSMLAARQRLRELNYSESMIQPLKSVELEPEVLAAPWNTSKAVVDAMFGRSYLDLERHLIDPTGPSREGFSCVSMVRSPTEVEQAKGMCPQDQQPKQPNNTQMLSSSSNPLRGKITQEKVKRLALYQREAQMISEIQSRCLSLDDPITSSEDEDGGEAESENMSESDFSQQLDNLNKMVLEGRSNQEVNYENEEAERRQMLIELGVNSNKKNEKNQPSSPVKSDECDPALLKNKILYITRTYEYGGKRIQSSEIVRDRRIIALYVKQKGGSLLRLGASGDKLQSIGCNRNSEKDDGLPGIIQVRSRSASLGPTELCRAEGTRLRISKKVLESVRPSRQCRRQSSGV